MARNVTPADLRLIRSAALSLLQSGFSVRDVTRSFDRFGKETFAYPLVSTVDGSIENTTGQEQHLIERLVNNGVVKTETAKVRLPFDTVVSTNQVIYSPDGRYWDVVHVGRDTHAAFTVVLVTRREVGNG